MNIHQSNQNDFPQPKITIDVLKKEMIRDLLFVYPNWVEKGSEQEKDIIRIWFMGAITALRNPNISNLTVNRHDQISKIMDDLRMLFTDPSYKIDDSFRPRFMRNPTTIDPDSFCSTPENN